MTSRAPYSVWGRIDGREIGPYLQSSVGAARRTAHKMHDQGVSAVRITDCHGNIVPQEEGSGIWTDNDGMPLIKRRRMDGR